MDIGRPINEVMAVRLNAMYEHSNSYRDGVDLERGGVNPTLTIKPTPQTKVVLSGEYFFDRRVADRGIPSFGTINGVANSGRPADTHWSTFFGNQDGSTSRIDTYALNSLIEHTFDNQLMVRNRTRYASYDKFYQNVFPNGPATAEDASGTVNIAAYNNAQQRDNIFNQTDFLYKVNTWGIKHEFMAGVEYGRQVTTNLRNSGFFNNSATSVDVPFLNPITFTPITYRPNATDANNHGVVEVVGVYMQDQITILPQVKAVLGLRYDNFDTNFINNRTGDRFHTNDGLLSPRAGLIYKPIETVSIYGNYSLAYVPRAGDQLASLTLSNAALKPEQFMNLEVRSEMGSSARPVVNRSAVSTGAEQRDCTGPERPHPNHAGGRSTRTWRGGWVGGPHHSTMECHGGVCLYRCRDYPNNNQRTNHGTSWRGGGPSAKAYGLDVESLRFHAISRTRAWGGSSQQHVRGAGQYRAVARLHEDGRRDVRQGEQGLTRPGEYRKSRRCRLYCVRE